MSATDDKNKKDQQKSKFFKNTDDFNPAYQCRSLARLKFGKYKDYVEQPSFDKIQRESYQEFLQLNTPKDKRKNKGLESVFRTYFPVTDNSGRIVFEYHGYDFDELSYTADEASRKSLTYSSPLKVYFSLNLYSAENPNILVESRKETIYLADFPMMTENSTFIISGHERTVVSHIQRAPGAFFETEETKAYELSKIIYRAKIIPEKGVWIDFEIDNKNIVYVRLDRKRKVLVSSLFLALPKTKNVATMTKEGLEDPEFFSSSATAGTLQDWSKEELLSMFYKTEDWIYSDNGWITPNFIDISMKGMNVPWVIRDVDTGEVIIEEEFRLSIGIIARIFSNKDMKLLLPHEAILNRYAAVMIVHPETGEVLAQAGDAISPVLLLRLKELRLTVKLLNGGLMGNDDMYFRNTLAADKHTTRQEALIYLYRTIRLDNVITQDNASTFLKNMFFDVDRYDISSVGRARMNERFGLNVPLDCHILTMADLIATLKHLIAIRAGKEKKDDIDNLKNRRLRHVGELFEVQCKVGVMRMQRLLKNRMSHLIWDHNTMPSDLIKTAPFTSVLKEFTISQWCQYASQTNFLSLINHQRTISTTTAGGSNMNRAVEARDIHPTHHGKICVITTPEGASIGLVGSLSCYAGVDEHGFITTPYVKIKDGKATKDVVWLNAAAEENSVIVPLGTLDEDRLEMLRKTSVSDQILVDCRYNQVYTKMPLDQVQYMDVSSRQIVSASSALLPFLDHNNVARGLMGSNMIKQAVPCLRSETPLVGTGLEGIITYSAGMCPFAKHDGEVIFVSNDLIVLKNINPQAPEYAYTVYDLVKWRKTNSYTCIHQNSLVAVGDFVKEGEILAGDYAIDAGQLALGHDVLVGYVSWKGFGFEDAIVVSEKVLQNDWFTSIHLMEFTAVTRETPLGVEEFTASPPGVRQEELAQLDTFGFPKIGSRVKPGDILFGIAAPIAETTPLTAHEHILRAVYADRMTTMQNKSSKVPAGVYGTVIDVQISSRKDLEKNPRTSLIENECVQKEMHRKQKIESLLFNMLKDDVVRILKDAEPALGSISDKNAAGIPCYSENWLRAQNRRVIEALNPRNPTTRESLKYSIDGFVKSMQTLEEKTQDILRRIEKSISLPNGVLQSAKVLLAVKQCLIAGDKMAGRHGNKGVVSYCAPVASMPFLEDGRPLDMMLNTLGVSGRMNLGQIMETHLGWAAHGLGKKLIPVLRAFIESRDEAVSPISSQREELSGTWFQEEYYDTTAYNAFFKKMSCAFWDFDEKTYQPYVDLVTKINELHRWHPEKSPLNVMTVPNVLKFSLRIVERGIFMATPIFDSAKTEEIDILMEEAYGTKNNQVLLRDGETGDYLDHPVTVGYKYLLKLHHLVNDKIHARSTGSYNIITQQPVGGKRQFGGQRCGEMEFWALQAHGAAFTILENITIKSDDYKGRQKLLYNIISNNFDFEYGTPASFSVLVQELRALCLNLAWTSFDKESHQKKLSSFILHDSQVAAGAA